MKATIKKIVEQVEALPESELDEFLLGSQNTKQDIQTNGTRRSNKIPRMGDL